MKQTIKRSLALALSLVMMLTMTLIGVKDIKAADADATTTATTTAVAPMYTALILDLSGSMSGEPISVQKDAAKMLVDAIINAGADNKVALVGLATYTDKLCGFTSNKDELYAAIDGTNAYGNTNMEDALKTAGELLEAEKIANPLVDKNIILCSDGLPQSGKWVKDGQYNSKDHWYYEYGNACYDTANDLKNNGVYIYTVGMFHSLSGQSFDFGKRLMEDLASPEKNFDPTSNATPKKASYTVTDMQDLIDKIVPQIIVDITVDPDPAPVDDTPRIILSTDNVTLREGETAEVTATLLPDSFAADNSVEFFMDKVKYATVDEQVEGSKVATITGVLEGETYMYATVAGYGDDIIAACHVTVYDKGLPDDADTTGIIGYNDNEDYTDDIDDQGGDIGEDQDVNSLSFEKESMSITVGNSKKLPLVTDPADLDYENLVFTSSDESVAEIDENVENDEARVVGNAPGKCTITVADKKGGNASATIDITVVPKSTEFTACTAKSSRKIGLKWKIADKAYCDGYQIQYSARKDFSSGVKKVNISKRKTTSTTIRSSLKAGRTQFVRIRVYKKIAGGKKVYSSWSKVRSAKVKN